MSDLGSAWRGRAPAKVNLFLHVLGRREDGYHELESLVAFAGVGAGDWLTFTPSSELVLTTDGPTAAEAGPSNQNLILKAARALAERVAGLRVGRFHLLKRLPVAAGLGGGSSNAAAALRALATHNELDLDDVRIAQAARSVGADVPVCLSPRARVMTGIGHGLGPAVGVAPLPTLLVSPGVATPTPKVFAALGLPCGASANFGPAAGPATEVISAGSLRATRNDLEAAAISVSPVIAEVLERLRALRGVSLVRMSGSGATCFALFDDRFALAEAARELAAERRGWWIRPTLLR